MTKELTEQEKIWYNNWVKRITNDSGKCIRPQYNVIEKVGDWSLLCDIHVIGDRAVHEFRVEKLSYLIELYPGISLEEAKEQFKDIVRNDY